MLILILVVPLIVILGGCIFLAIQRSKRKMKASSLSFILTFILTIIVPALIITYVLYGLSCMGGCYVTKYTPQWFFTMHQSHIAYLPISEPVNEAQYYYHTELGVRWEIRYKSNSQIDQVQEEIQSYLIKKVDNPDLKASCRNGYWDFDENTVIMDYKSGDGCIVVYLDNMETYVSVRVLEIE